MSKEIAGQIFSTKEELGLEPLSDDEVADAKKLFAQARAEVAKTAPHDRVQASPKFWDDTSGTEYDQRRPGRG